MATLFEVEGLAKAFGGIRAVDRVSFAVEAGQRVALIGPNGAGKSTCFNLLGGQLRADAGTVRLDGRPLLGRPAAEICRLGVGRTFQIAAAFGSLSVAANVQMALHSRERRWLAAWHPAGAGHRAEALALLERVGLAAEADSLCAELAYGALKRLELALALAGAPRLLLMDEPTAGLAPDERQELMALVSALARDAGLAVLFTEHDMDVVFGHADRVVVLDHGRVLTAGEPGAVRADSRVQAVYLGAPGLAAPPPRPARPPGTPLLEVRDLQGWYGKAQALHAVSFTLEAGQPAALLGRNGAGKSTLLKALAGLLGRRAGAARYEGRNLLALDASEIARLGVGYVPEDRRLFPQLTVDENLETGRQPARASVPSWTRERVFALFPNLESLTGARAGTLSGGEQQMLAIARTLMGNPRLLLLDEPSEGLAPRVVQAMIAMLRTLDQSGVSLLLAEQSLTLASAVAQHAWILEKGAIRASGAMAALADDPENRRAWLAV
jgi:branched-chain amino acid transport system ATP-binding protein